MWTDMFITLTLPNVYLPFHFFYNHPQYIINLWVSTDKLGPFRNCKFWTLPTLTYFQMKISSLRLTLQKCFHFSHRFLFFASLKSPTYHTFVLTILTLPHFFLKVFFHKSVFHDLTFAYYTLVFKRKEIRTSTSVSHFILRAGVCVCIYIIY